MELSRREFARHGLKVMAGSMVVPAFFQRTALAAEKDPKFTGPLVHPDNILVLVQLAGGNDGLNTVIPYTEKDYYRFRPTLGISKANALDLDGKIGLHPSMEGMQKIFNEKKLTVLQGVGYPNSNRSHFKSTDIWMTGNPTKPEGTGWVGRYLDTINQSKHPFPGISLGSSGERVLKGAKTAVPSFRNLDEFRLFPDEKDMQKRDRELEVFKALHRKDGGHFAQAGFLQDASMNAFVSSENLKSLVGRYQTRVQYPNNGLGRSLRLAGQMIASGLNTKAFHVSLGGFDTHSNQANGHANRLGTLSASLAAFFEDLRAMNKSERVIVMTYSEFGRRVKENGSKGTDHGSAAPLFVMGEKIKGSIIGVPPSLTDLRGGDLKYAIDFRSIYSALLINWLGADPKEVFGAMFEPVQLFG